MDEVERVARAIVEELGRQDGYDDPQWLNTDGTIAWLDQGEVDMYEVARAAIKALNEPAITPPDTLTL